MTVPGEASDCRTRHVPVAGKRSAPPSVAIVGASERGQWQGMIYRNLRELKYPGRVYPVNPRQKEVFGEPCSLRCARFPKRCSMPW